MTNGQIAQIQELRKCHFASVNDLYEFEWYWITDKSIKLEKWEKAILRRLWHQYRHQIKAMKKNRVA